MNENVGGPAFPANHFDLTDGEHGMTLRDYFAAKAMQAYLSSYPRGVVSSPIADIAADAWDMADAMLKERTK